LHGRQLNCGNYALAHIGMIRVLLFKRWPCRGAYRAAIYLQMGVRVMIMQTWAGRSLSVN